jgi:hypothetical protein
MGTSLLADDRYSLGLVAERVLYVLYVLMNVADQDLKCVCVCHLSKCGEAGEDHHHNIDDYYYFPLFSSSVLEPLS